MRQRGKRSTKLIGPPKTDFINMHSLDNIVAVEYYGRNYITPPPVHKQKTTLQYL